MKYLLWIAALALALFCAPFARRDTAALLPVQTVCLSRDADGYLLQTDGGLQGRGTTVADALASLHATAPGDVVLATARQLVVQERCLPALPELLRLRVLRPATQICCARAALSPDRIGAFLAAHPSGITLSQVEAALLRLEPLPLPRLLSEEGRLRLYAA